MLMSVMGVFSKHVLNQPKDKKKRLSGSPPNVTKFSPADSVKLAADLNRIVLRLYGQFLSDDGKHVSYDGIGSSPLFEEYRTKCEQLALIDLGALSTAEKKAMCLNIYNTLLIHAFVEIGPPHSSAARLKFFTTAAYDIGGQVYSLNDIEHGILRGNRKFLGKRPFSDHDERLPFALKPADVDARIHFGLVCGAKSCPPIRIFTPENLEQALTLAAQAFCRDNVEISKEDKTVKLSMIFKWYEEDFGDSVLAFVRPYLEEDKRKDADAAIAGHYTVSHAEYSWDVNK